jgi:O-antigen/teichoic acid export membrane protein
MLGQGGNMKSTNKNFLYNLFYQLFSFIIPLITIPYVSRRLGANSIGIYSYTYSIINYFMLTSMLGINNYGSREIAKSSSDLAKKSKTFFSIYYLQLICTGLMILLFIVFLNMYNYEYKLILLIQGIYLISCALDINWYFFGVEKFKITISRNIIIKILSLLFIFVLVKGKEDLWIYTLILSASTLISQLYLWIYMKDEIRLVPVRFSDIISHLKNCILLFVPVVAYSIYRITDKTMIGVLSNTIQLGNYESAEKVINIPLSVISALGSVMLPHMSKTEDAQFAKKIEETFKLCFFILFPIFIGLMIISEDFSNVFFGRDFIYTANIIRFLIITILFSGVTNIIRNNYLIPKSKDKIYVKSTVYGATINLVLNLMFIRKYGAYGACIGTVCAELTVMLYQVLMTQKEIDYIYNLRKVSPFLIKSLIMGVIIILINHISFHNDAIKVILQITIGGLVYLGLNQKYILYEFIGIKN